MAARESWVPPLVEAAAAGAGERTPTRGARPRWLGGGGRPVTRHLFEYAVLRVVPRVDRGETMNAGVLLYCRPLDYLGSRVWLDEDRLRALDPDADAAVGATGRCRRRRTSAAATRTPGRRPGRTWASGSAG